MWKLSSSSVANKRSPRGVLAKACLHQVFIKSHYPLRRFVHLSHESRRLLVVCLGPTVPSDAENGMLKAFTEGTAERADTAVLKVLFYATLLFHKVSSTGMITAIKFRGRLNV